MIQGKGSNSLVNLFVAMWAASSFKRMVRKEGNRQALLRQAGVNPHAQTNKFLLLVFISCIVFAVLIMIMAVRSY